MAVPMVGQKCKHCENSYRKDGRWYCAIGDTACEPSQVKAGCDCFDPTSEYLDEVSDRYDGLQVVTDGFDGQD